MKKFVYIILLLLVCSCQAQRNIIDIKNSDLILFKSKTKEELLYREVIFKNDGIYLTKEEWELVGYGYIFKYFSFNQDKDTMNIKCKCGQGTNYYFENFEFQKGNFELSFEKTKYKISGNRIKTSKKIQNLLFRNAYVWWDDKGIFKHLKFKDLKFIEIDLKDSVNVKLKRLD